MTEWKIVSRILPPCDVPVLATDGKHCAMVIRRKGTEDFDWEDPVTGKREFDWSLPLEFVGYWINIPALPDVEADRKGDLERFTKTCAYITKRILTGP